MSSGADPAGGWDVVVVGGGPAGSVTAKLLAGRGRRVLVIDRAQFPRRKACGESVNPGAVRELDRLGLLQLVGSVPHRRVDGWSIHPMIGPSFMGKFGGEVYGLGIDRSLFDAALLEAAATSGAELRTGMQVTDLAMEAGRVVGVVTRDGRAIRSRLVVGADGLRSVVVRRLKLLARRPRLRKVGLTAHLRGVKLERGTGELYLTGWGCVGAVEISPDTVNAVVVLNDSEARRATGGAAAAFDAIMGHLPAFARARRTSTVQTTGPFDCPTRSIVADGALLVGDAAGYYDPFTGQGIYRALRGARLAADWIDRALDSGDVSADWLSGYVRAHRRLFAPGERVQRLVEATTSRPHLMALAAIGLGSLPLTADRLVAITGDVHASG